MGNTILPARGTHGDEGALAAVLPASARVVAGVGGDERALGADDGRSPDVVLTEGALPEQAFSAPVVVMSLMSAPRLLDGGSRAADAVLRFAAYTFSRTRSATAARRLRARGFENLQVIQWDHRQPFPLPGRPRPRVPPWHPHRYPRRALVRAARGDMEPSILDAALYAAGDDEPDSVLASEAALVALTESSVIRVAVGGGRGQVLRPVQTYRTLHEADPDPVLADRVPWVEAHGATGLGVWSAERRLPGGRAVPPLSEKVLDDCRSVLVELFRLGAAASRTGRTCKQDVQHIADAVPSEAAATAERLAAAADHVLVGLPLGFGHGDFWYDNLLIDSDRLTGVLDWDSAGPGRLPLIDLLHLLLSARRPVPGYRWGTALVEELMPWAESGADDLGRRYCRELGLDSRPAVLRAFVIAYWLDWLRYQFDRYADRSTRSRWVANNVVHVARKLDRAGWAQR